MAPRKTSTVEWCFWAALWTLPIFLHSEFLAEVFKTYASFDRTHQDVKELILAALMIALIVPLAIHGPWPRRFKPVGILLLVIMASELIALSNSEYPRQALSRTLLDFLLIAWGWWWWSRPDREDLTRVLCGFLFGVTAVLCLVGLVSFWRQSDSGQMSYNPVGHRYYWAELLMGTAPLACLHPKRLVVWRNGLLVLIPVGILLFALGRRMPVIALALGAVAVVIIAGVQRYQAGGFRIPRKQLLIGATAVIFVAGSGYLLERSLVPEDTHGPTPGLVSRIGATISSVAGGDPYAIDPVRAPMYVQATKAVFREPLGYGRGTFSLQFFDIAFRDHDPEHPPVEIPSIHPYNTFLHVAVEGGVVAGLALFCLWTWIVVRLIRRLLSAETPDHLGYALLAGMIAFSFDSLTFSSVEYPTTRLLWGFYFVAAIAWLDAAPRGPEKPAPGIRRLWQVIGFGFLGFTCLVVGSTFVANNKAVRAEAMTSGAVLDRLRDRTARDQWLENASNLCETALFLNPDPYEHHLTAASIARHRGDLEKCKGILNAYIDKHPYQVRALEALADAHEVEGNAEAKASAVRRILQIWPVWKPPKR